MKCLTVCLRACCFIVNQSLFAVVFSDCERACSAFSFCVFHLDSTFVHPLDSVQFSFVFILFSAKMGFLEDVAVTTDGPCCFCYSFCLNSYYIHIETSIPTYLHLDIHTIQNIKNYIHTYVQYC